MPEVKPQEAQQLIEAGAQLVDIRADDEYAAGHIPGSLHIPIERLQADGAGLDRGQPVVVYCRSGDRSGVTAEAFAASGWDAHSIAGGLLAWTDESLPLEPADGEVVQRSGLPPR